MNQLILKNGKRYQRNANGFEFRGFSAVIRKKRAKIVHQIIVMYTIKKKTLLETNKDIEKIRTDLNFWGQKEESRKSASFVFSGVGG